MPLLTIPLGVRTGARVRARFTINRATLLTLRQSGRPIPQPILVEAVLDTGAERTCVDPSVAARAALSLYGFGFSTAPGTSAPTIPALGGTTVNTIYQASAAIVRPTRHSDLIIPKSLSRPFPSDPSASKR